MASELEQAVIYAAHMAACMCVDACGDTLIRRTDGGIIARHVPTQCAKGRLRMAVNALFDSEGQEGQVSE